MNLRCSFEVWLLLDPSERVKLIFEALKLDDEPLKECVWLLLHTLNMHTAWRPVEEMRRLGVILITIALKSFQTLERKVADAGNIACSDLLLEACEGELMSDPELQKVALNVVINCVCAPFER
uniref:Uncharacterized protein n=1 Tax=Parascaris equorum TaxID=6256 RepID=A0A914S1G5_PAREQ